jgi:hypothetical protein
MVRRLVVLACLALALTVAMTPAATAKKHGTGGANPSPSTLCLNDGWQDLVRSDGSRFASQRECTQYAAAGGVLSPASAQQLLCESYAGLYSGPDEYNLWSCHDWSIGDAETQTDETSTRSSALGAYCTSSVAVVLVDFAHGVATYYCTA